MKSLKSIISRPLGSLVGTFEVKKQALYNFTGPVAPVVTPYDKRGVLNPSQILPYAKYLSMIGAKGVFISGTNGESFLLTLEERLTLVETWRQALDQLPESRKLAAIVNVSSTAPGDAIKLSQKAEQLGFDGVAMLPPIYYQVSTKDHLVRYVKMILNEGAPNTPFLYYHIPTFTGELKFELESFLELALDQIPQFTAVKYSDANLVRFGSMQAKFGDRLNLFPGMDETLLPTRSFGTVVKAAICASFNLEYAVQHYNSMMKAMDRGDLNQALQEHKAIAVKREQFKKSGNQTAALKRELNRQLEPEGVFLGMPRIPMYFGDV